MYKTSLLLSMVSQLEEAARDNALTPDELQAWLGFMSLPEHGKKTQAELPESLWPAADRVLLWQQVSPSNLLH